MTAVLIADDQALQRTGLRMLVETQPDLTVTGEATTGPEAVRMAAALQPDVVLMSLSLPDTDGIEATRRIVTSGGRSRVLLLTTADHERHAYAALRAGAGGVLLDDTPVHELAAAIRAVAAGDAVLAPSLTRRLIDAFRDRLSSSVPEGDQRLATLTGRERDVLDAIAHGWSNAEIAQRLSIAPTTVKSHVSRVLAKIGAHARVQAVAFAYETGLVRSA